MIRAGPVTRSGKGAGNVEVEYAPKGPAGKQCRDCKFFEPGTSDPSQGECFGKDVMASGACNMFTSS